MRGGIVTQKDIFSAGRNFFSFVIVFKLTPEWYLAVTVRSFGMKRVSIIPRESQKDQNKLAGR